MTRRPEDEKRWRTAKWRYEQIQDALAEHNHALRSAIVQQLAHTPVVWPTGKSKPISPATSYRWIDAYEELEDLRALLPARREDKGKQRTCLPDDVLQKALELWANDTELTFTMLIALLEADPELGIVEKGIHLNRSTLQRRLAAQPLYSQLRRLGKRTKRRGRFVARKPHAIWHLDVKGPATATCSSGKPLTFHVITVLDDATRAVLGALVVETPDLCAAVRVIRLAIKRWGIPEKLYCDRASIFDSHAFRAGLAMIGCHRICTRPGNAPAHGKIEAYHRTLSLWFYKRLPHQRVVDLVHLQQLLDALLDRVYQNHRHRGLKMSPRLALNDRVSDRQVAPQRLLDAFRKEHWLKSHPTTGEVDIRGVTYLVPDDLRGRRLCFRIDPDPLVEPTVAHPETEDDLPLVRAAIRPEDGNTSPSADRWVSGPLQTLYDAWQGKRRPLAEPGFGLSEIMALLARATGRPVPRSDAEAALVQRVYREVCPLPRQATEAAFVDIVKELGHGRPLLIYLEALKRRVVKPPVFSRRKKP
ncbi:MAG: DDE-type integrase/transposase/recombinase [Pseudomonadota bacterium]